MSSEKGILTIPKGWDNLEDLDSFTVEKGEHGFAGRLIDKNGKTINILGMISDNIGFSYDETQTNTITEREFKRARAITKGIEIKTTNYKE